MIRKLKSLRRHPWRQSFFCWLAILLLWIATFTPATAAPGQVRKVICQYALTSANDFPQRDPQDWRLLGSNDGGQTWTTLDVRQNEIFQTRQQRKLYRINNQTAYETYRLVIDRVRSPDAVDSVQLAEIEVMGKTEDDLSPMPLITDIVSAQGDNPPSETVGNLFDGRVETKWLDWPPNELSRSSWVQWKYLPPTPVTITNIDQLKSMGARAGNGYPIRINTVFVGAAAPGDKLCFVDETGFLELANVPGAAGLGVGQDVLVTGSTLKSGWSVTIDTPEVRPLAPPPAGNPAQISLEQPLSPEKDLQWVQIQGEIQSGHSSKNEYAFQLADGALSMQVRLRCPTALHSLPPPGTKVSLSGICSGAYNEQGQWVAASLWAAGWNSLNVINPTPHVPSPAFHHPRVKPAIDDSTVLTTIEQIRRLTPEQINSRPRVKIRAIITGLLEGFVQDDTAGIQVRFPSSQSRKLTQLADYIEINGHAELDEVGNPQISADQVEVLGKGKLPAPQHLSTTQLLTGHMEAQWIEVDGVVHSTDGAHLLIISNGRELIASLATAQTALVDDLVDAEVRARGVGVPAMDEQGRIQGIHLLIPSLDEIDVLEPPGDPQKLPIRHIGNLLGLSGPRESFHRVKVEGIVTFCDGHRIFLQDDTGSAMCIFKENALLDANFGRSRWLYWWAPQTNALPPAGPTYLPGEQVQVVGFPETRRYSPVLTQITVTRMHSAGTPAPVELTTKGIEEGGLDSSLVTFDGVLRAQNAVGGNIILTFDWRDRTLQVVVPERESDVLQIAINSTVRVTGICQVDPSPFAELGLRAAAVRVLARTSDDLVVLDEPSWWTIERALLLIGGMALAILAALIWIRELRRQVEERTEQLTAEVKLREQTERQHALDQERARIAKDLHDDLGANLTQIVFLCQRVESASSQETNEASRWFNLIPATARRTIQSLDEIVWAINPRHDSLESLANYLSQFAQEHLTLARVRCTLDVPTVLPALPLSAEVRHNVLLTVREALQNVVTHAEATEVRLGLSLNASEITIAITDNGKGFNPASIPHDGNGLPNMERRLLEIGGHLKIQSEPGRGTTILLVIPRSVLHTRVIGDNGSQSKTS